MSRAARFIEEFEEDLDKDVDWKPGDILTFSRSYITTREGDGEQVVRMLVFLDKKGDEVQFEGDGVLFDPEDTASEIRQYGAEAVGMEQKEFLARMKRADLL